MIKKRNIYLSCRNTSLFFVFVFSKVIWVYNGVKTRCNWKCQLMYKLTGKFKKRYPYFLFVLNPGIPPSVVSWLWSIKVDSGHKYLVWCWWSRQPSQVLPGRSCCLLILYAWELQDQSLLWHLSHSIKTICLSVFPSEFITRQWSPEGKGCIYLSLYLYHQFHV